MDNVVLNITEQTDNVQINVVDGISKVFVNPLTMSGDGTFANPLSAVAGSGDMLRATYDPTNVNADAFSMENMIEGATKKILTSAERTKLNNLSGTNTGDQDLTPYLTSATAAATYQPIGAYLTSISGLNISQLTNDSGYITSAALSPYLTATAAAATYQPIGSYLTSISGLNISQLTNDSGFITSAALTGLVPTSRTITINGTTYDLSADRSWTISAGTTYTFSTGLTNNAGTVTNNLSTGVAGGQSVVGGTAASNNLTLSSTSNATKGKILFGNSAYDEVNNRLGIGTTSPTRPLDIKSSDSNSIFARMENMSGGEFIWGITGGSYSIVSNVGTSDFAIRMTGDDNKFRFKPTGQMGIGVANPNASALLELSSTTRGFLPPRMTSTQASAIASPAEGLLLYVTDTNATFTSKGWWGYNGSTWEKLNN